MIYLGTLGRMVGIKCPASQSVDTEERYTFQQTLEGRRKAQQRAHTRRTWTLQTSEAATPEDIAAVQQFAMGAWGNGPFWFVSAEAPYTNLLRPSVARCDTAENPSGVVIDGGPVLVNGTWFARSYLNPSGVTVFFGKDSASGSVPVIAGRRVTGAVHVTGSGARAQLSFYDAAGNSLGSYLGSPTAGASTWVRSSVSAIPPAGAVSARVFANGSTVQAAGPSITWTDKAAPWGGGAGCSKAVVQPGSNALTLTGVSGTYSSFSYNIMEVG